MVRTQLPLTNDAVAINRGFATLTYSSATVFIN